MAGAVVGSRELLEKIFFDTYLLLGGILGPFDAWLLNRGMRTLPERMRRHHASGLAVAGPGQAPARVTADHAGAAALVRVIAPTLRGLLSDDGPLKVVAYDPAPGAAAYLESAAGVAAVRGGPMTPDQIVYAGSFPLLFEPPEGVAIEDVPTSLRAALEQSGMLPFKLSAAERQLRQIGRPRAKQLYGWLLAADLAIKGHNSTKDRARRELETLIVRLANSETPLAVASR